VLSLTRERPDHRVRPREYLWWAALVAALLALVAPLLQSLGDVARHHVTFANSTPWEVDVSLVLDAGRSRMPLATVGPQRTMRVDEIPVPTGDWDFEFSAWDQVGHVTVSSRQLRVVNNRIVVPRSLVRALEAADPPHSPFGT
jgi:hypothetical protein